MPKRAAEGEAGSPPRGHAHATSHTRSRTSDAHRASDEVVDLTADSDADTPPVTTSTDDGGGRTCTLGCGQWVAHEHWGDHTLLHALQQSPRPTPTPSAAPSTAECAQCGAKVPLQELDSHELMHTLQVGRVGGFESRPVGSPGSAGGVD